MTEIRPAIFNAASAIANKFGNDLNIPDLLMAIQMERSTILESQIRDQMADMKKRNDWLKQANDVLGIMRTNRPGGASDPAKEYGSFKPNAVVNDPGPFKGYLDASSGAKVDVEGKVSVHGWFLANGVQIEQAGNDTKGTQAEFDAAISNLKAQIDTVNSQSQMDMVRLQGLMDKRNQAFDMMTNFLSKTGKSLDSVIGNMR